MPSPWPPSDGGSKRVQPDTGDTSEASAADGAWMEWEDLMREPTVAPHFAAMNAAIEDQVAAMRAQSDAALLGMSALVRLTHPDARSLQINWDWEYEVPGYSPDCAIICGTDADQRVEYDNDEAFGEAMDRMARHVTHFSGTFNSEPNSTATIDIGDETVRIEAERAGAPPQLRPFRPPTGPRARPPIRPPNQKPE